MSLNGELALVTGASRGIGKAIATELAARGARVVGTATTQAGADGISDYLGEQGVGRVLDVGDQASIDALLKAVNEELGPLTVLVNNAGITRDNLLMRMKEEEWEAVLNTNLRSVFRLSKACLRGMMKQRHGRIINIGSVVGMTGNPGQANYAAAKEGMMGFSKSMAREVGSRNITVNVVAPGFIDTEMTQALPEAQRERLQQEIALGRLGDPRDVANAVAFLASPEAAYITGETLNVNGGMFMP